MYELEGDRKKAGGRFVETDFVLMGEWKVRAYNLKIISRTCEQ
jgi:hypothetical protein